MLEITITVDTNDGDYATEISEISEEDLETIKPLIAAIKKFKPYKTKSKSGYDLTHDHNYPYDECLREDMGEKSPRDVYKFNTEVFDIFEDLVPCSEYGFHTIESITTAPLHSKTKLL